MLWRADPEVPQQRAANEHSRFLNAFDINESPVRKCLYLHAKEF